MKPGDHSAALEALAVKHDRPHLEVLELFNERAAIREYDGMYGRDEAERMALGDVAELLGCARGLQPSQHASSTGGES